VQRKTLQVLLFIIKAINKRLQGLHLMIRFISLIFTLILFVFLIFAYFNLNLVIETKAFPVQPYNTVVSTTFIKDVALHRTQNRIKVIGKDLECLAHNIYYEAGIEGYRGKIAVAQVTWNRVKHGRWGDSICDVVYSPHQFSWTKKRKLEKPKGQLWEDSLRAAHDFVKGIRIKSMQGVLYYHATWLDKPPYWAKHKIHVVEIGQHAFYKPKL